jgi:hypothetical protein
MEKFIIDKELVESFVNVITSNDDEGIKMTMDILSNRDVKDKESESNFKEIMTKILKDDVLFPKTSIFIIKMGDRTLTCNGYSSFPSETEAKKQLSFQLTKIIGSKTNQNISHRMSPYRKVLRDIFKSGNDLRNFLVKNNLVDIIEIK